MAWGGIKRDKRDIVFSKFIRTRARWCCDYCLRDFSHNKGGLHCSHVFGRRHKGTRWDPQNAFAHCIKCHKYLEENPLIFAEWVKGKIGQEKYDRLLLKHHKPTHFTKFDLEMIYKDLKEMLKKEESTTS